ncbi:hypothetical protein EYF80_023973 [Liparis tanakae]|uniref:Uncharacterized protein n=1 Tax=Liparis tanakae TaxID=230148 RepID=A0A4Z2HJP9_9TELE|nr:hypothetical protein EYF80_023973 [Liparis tanakae]
MWRLTNSHNDQYVNWCEDNVAAYQTETRLDEQHSVARDSFLASPPCMKTALKSNVSTAAFMYRVCMSSSTSLRFIAQGNFGGFSHKKGTGLQDDERSAEEHTYTLVKGSVIYSSIQWKRKRRPSELNQGEIDSQAFHEKMRHKL